MKATNLLKAIEKLGGTGSVVTRTLEMKGYCDVPYLRTKVTLTATLAGYDVEMNCDEDGETDFYTVRRISQRGHFDAGSDYNSGGYTFCNRIKELAWAVNL